MGVDVETKGEKAVKTTLQIIDPRAFAQWDASILQFDNASFFHSSSWARLLAEAYNFKPVYCALFDNDRLAAAIPLMEVRSILGTKKGVSLPFSDFCQPLFRSKSDFDKVFAFAVDTGRSRHWKSLALRGNSPFPPEASAPEACYRHTLALKRTEQEIFKSFRNSTQRNIRKAAAAGVVVDFHAGYDAIKGFYRLNCLARRDHGLPPQPFHFFEAFYRTIIEPGHGEIALARKDGEIVSAAIFLLIGTLASYKYGASDSRKHHTRASYLLMWEAIRRYNALHYDTFCFGRTEAAHTGLLQFKNGWGTKQEAINYFTYDMTSRSFTNANLITSGIHNAFFRHMPLAVLKTISLALYRYMG